MSFIKKDRVQEISSSTGTGAMVLGGAYDASYRTFDSQMANGDTTQVLILNLSAPGEWETVEGTYESATNSILRTQVVSSSNNDTTVNFTSGTKVVSMLPIASTMVVEDNSGNATITGELSVLGGIRGGFPPGCAVATFGNNATYVSQPLVIDTMWPIRSIQQTESAATMSIIFYVIPKLPDGTTPTSVIIRVDAGMNMVTYGAHPADQLTAWTLTPTADAYTFILDGSTYVDSIFMEGHCYVPGTLTDNAAEWNTLFAWCIAQNGPCDVWQPPGLSYVQSATVSVAPSVTFHGAGIRNSGFVFADYADLATPKPEQVIRVTGETYSGSNLSFSDTTIYGNRTQQLYGRGSHAISLGGGDSSPLKKPTLTVNNVAVYGSSGYGVKIDGEVGYEHVYLTNVTVKFSDGDGTDSKNRLDLNTDILYDNWRVFYWAMASMGTNLEPVVTFAADPVTTVSGSTDFVVPRYSYLPDAAGGELCTLTGPIYNGIDLTNTFQCIGVAADTVMLRGLVAATGSGTGGGSGMTAFMPHYSHGDAAIDTRCPYGEIRNPYIEGHFFGRNGARQRGGVAGSSNGLGSDYLVMNNIRGVDTTPSWVGDVLQGELAGCVSIEGLGAKVNGIQFIGSSSSCMVRSAASSRQITIANGNALGVSTGYLVQGENVQIEGGVIRDYTLHGARVHGGMFGDTHSLPNDPFLCQAIGTAVVIVTDPGHGLTTGNDVSFINPPALTYGVVIERSNIRNYSVTVLNVDEYTITATGSATNDTDSFGGEDVDVRYPPTDHTAENIQIRGVSFEQTSSSNSARPLCIGAALDEDELGQANNVMITDCNSVNAGLRVLDCGSNVTWGPGNSGDLEEYNLPRNRNAASTWTLVPGGEVVIGATAFPFIDFTELGDFSHIRVEVMGFQNGTASQNAKIYVSDDKCVTLYDTNGDYQRIGDSVSTDAVVFCGSMAVATAYSAEIEITNFNRAATSFFVIGGGQNSSATATQSAGAFTTAAVALNGIRLEVGGSFTAGTVRVYQKGG